MLNRTDLIKIAKSCCIHNKLQLIRITPAEKIVNDRQRKDDFAFCYNERKYTMKKLALISMVVAGVALMAMGCSTQGGLDASGSAQTSASPAGVQGGVGVQAGTSVDVQPSSASADVSGSVSGSAGADASAQ